MSMSTDVAVGVELQHGALQANQSGASTAVDVQTEAGSMTAQGDNIYWIRHDADATRTTVVTQLGLVSILPVAENIEILLQSGEMVTFDETDVGSIVRLKRVYLPYLAR